MAYQTLTYSETSDGWPSFYSYQPESILGLNNFLYTFDKGNLYRHNTSSNYATYYDQGPSPTIIKSVFNEAPLEAKLFKTIELHSDVAWTAYDVVGNAPKTGLQVSGININTDFEQKEGVWFSYLRNVETAANSDIPTNQYGLRSVQGVGAPTVVTNAGLAGCVLEFNVLLTGAAVELPPMISVGDYLYQCDDLACTNSLNLGVITAVDHAANTITIDNSVTANVAAIDLFCLFVQDSQAESHGIIGQYLEFSLTITTQNATELFAVESDMMKSFP